MTPLLFLAIAVAGGIGAGLRYGLDLAVQRAVGVRIPWGILAVNLTGALALGLVTAIVSDAAWMWILGTGLLGGYTTFSSVAVTTAILAGEKRPRASLGYALANFVGSVGLAAAGLALGRVLVGG